MSNLAYEDQMGDEDGEAAALRSVRPIPRISIQAFCETEAVASPIERAGQDRRMLKTHLNVHMGGISTALEF